MGQTADKFLQTVEEYTPRTFRLIGNYPNPFNPVTSIEYELDKQLPVSLRVYNLAGREVATLVNGEKNAGRYRVEFDASNLASGVYIYRLSTPTGVLSQSMTIVK